MIITYHGLQFVKLQTGDTVVAFNAPSKDSKYKKPSFGADIALTSINHSDFNGGASLVRGEKAAFLIEGPGEYEVQGIFIKGLQSESDYAGAKRINTIYHLSMDGMNVCFLGALSNKTLLTEAKEALSEVDILFVPIAGDGVLSPSDAYKLAVSIEPKIIIPIQFEKGDKNLKLFLKEGGNEKLDTVDKLTLKRKDLEGREADIVVIEEQG